MKKDLGCESCGLLGCRLDEDYPSFCPTKKLDQATIDKVLEIYRNDPLTNKITKVSSAVEAHNYLKATRVEETVDFIKRMGFKKVGIASCISMLPETRVFCKILKSHGIKYEALSCKVGAIEKEEVGISKEDKIRKNVGHESMCNPVLQSKYFENMGVDFVVMIGLCVGHDTLFYMHCDLPVTTLIVKDRVTCHNPAAPLHYIDGIYKKILNE